jgi:hypothetical protein
MQSERRWDNQAQRHEALMNDTPTRQEFDNLIKVIQQSASLGELALVQAMRARGENLVLRSVCSQLLGVLCTLGRSPDDALTVCLESMENTISEILGEVLKSGSSPEIMKGIEETANYIRKDASEIFGFLKSSDNPF